MRRFKEYVIKVIEAKKKHEHARSPITEFHVEPNSPFGFFKMITIQQERNLTLSGKIQQLDESGQQLMSKEMITAINIGCRFIKPDTVT